jgi:hypothetical protein
MKTISIENRVAGFPRTDRLGGPGASGRDLPAWLPVPTVQPRKKAPAAPAHTRWIRSRTESFGERLMLGLLILAAVIAIGSGVSCLLDLVGNWASFNTGVAQLVQ